MGDIRAEIKVVLRKDHPMTVRQVFYQLVVRGRIEKTELAYKGTVIRLLTDMRMSEEIPFSWIVDESRRTRQTQTFDNIQDALKQTAEYYRRSALRESGVYIELWSEKEALSGVIWGEASDYDVPVVVSKGVPSLTQLYGSFENIRAAAQAGKRSYLYQFGDHDPSGCLIPRIIEARLKEFCEKYDCPPPIVKRIALTPEQIERSSRAADGGVTWELFVERLHLLLDRLPPGSYRFVGNSAQPCGRRRLGFLYYPVLEVEGPGLRPRDLGAHLEIAHQKRICVKG
jgi:hypothetical protein